MLEAAGRLFYERGITTVGVDTVAAEAGVTKKTLYDQFGSKATLVTEYLAERDRQFRAWVDQAVQDSQGVDRALAVFDALDSWMKSRSPQGCAFVHAHADLVGSLEHPAHDVIRGEKEWLRELFESLARDAGHPRPEATAIQLLALLEGATVLRSISGVPEAIGEARAAAGMILRGGV